MLPRASLLLFGLLVLPAALGAQADPRLAGRWVATHQGQPLHFDFYGDTMVVVNDHYALDYRATFDSLVAYGDTSFAVAYWFSLDRMIVQTIEGNVVTMTRQSPLARPINGRWIGSPAGDGSVVQLEMGRGGVARWRHASAREWVQGEWTRRSRIIEFTWMPDSTMWVGRYDPFGEALLFDEIYEGGGTAVLRKYYRRE